MNDGSFDGVVLSVSGGQHLWLETLFLNPSLAALFVRSKRPLQSRMDRGSCIVGSVQSEFPVRRAVPSLGNCLGIIGFTGRQDGRTGTVIVEPLLMEWLDGQTSKHAACSIAWQGPDVQDQA